MLAAKLIYKLRAALELFEQEASFSLSSRWKKLDTLFDRPVKLIIGDKEIFGIFAALILRAHIASNRMA